jgi:hypothetical protein
VVAILNFGKHPTSDNVRSVWDVPTAGMVTNVGIAVGIMSPAHCVQLLFPLPVSVAVIFDSVVGQRRKLLGNVESVISASGLVENMGLAIEIPSLSQAIQTLLPLPLLRPQS